MKESWARGNMRFLAASSGKQFIAVLLLCGFGLCIGADTITFESLLNEMVDRESITRFPEPSYTCRQFSSYDRDSVGPDKKGWFANWDRSQFVRVEDNNGRKEYILMDAEGAGAVVRFWGTWHGPAGGTFSNGMMRCFTRRVPGIFVISVKWCLPFGSPWSAISILGMSTVNCPGASSTTALAFLISRCLMKKGSDGCPSLPLIVYPSTWFYLSPVISSFRS